ncbi:hypothetical protein Zmor_020177 [Zophobas morio]|uniref:CRAL-TRIO domain-containing protein n=1 Tax=Zophobas morio TaxID=2755281 RepID=A0AA38MA28_9CUCU|nr:hypothetical protein Zmor_020177 [Zophobas morio]
MQLQRELQRQQQVYKLNRFLDFEAILFLKKCDYRLIHSQTVIDTYFTLKNLWPDVFQDRNWAKSPQQQGILDTMIIMTLPKRTPEGSTIIFMKALNDKMVNYKLETFFKYVHLVCMLDVYQNGPPNGHIIVQDIQPFPASFVPKMEYGPFKKFFYYDYEVLPTIQIKGMHFFNSNPKKDDIVGVLESAALKSLLPLVLPHESVDDLVKHVPKECLPQDYGGLLDTSDALHEKSKSELLKNGAFFEWQDQLTVDESKRPANNTIAQNMFGFEK